MSTSSNRTDQAGYNALYADTLSRYADQRYSAPEAYVRSYESTAIAPFHVGGNTKGYARGVAVRALISAVEATGRPPTDITVLDAGCGQGELSAYLGAKGFKVIGVDISEAGCAASAELARRVGVEGNCRFLANSLENIDLEPDSVDFVIGHASLHHFIKYEQVPAEFARVMKPQARGFFADSFGENPLYRLFHNRERMQRLGDVVLSRKLILDYFEGFDVTLLPTDWFVMLDKLYLKVAPRKLKPLVRTLSRLHFRLDRAMPAGSRLALALSGSVVTSIAPRGGA